MPGEAFVSLMALVVFALVINWAMISLAHITRQAKRREGVEPKFKALLYPQLYLPAVYMVLRDHGYHPGHGDPRMVYPGGWQFLPSVTGQNQQSGNPLTLSIV